MMNLVIALRESIEEVRPRLKQQALNSSDSLRVGNVVLIDYLTRLHGMLDNLERNPAAWRAIELQDSAVTHVVGLLDGTHGGSDSGNEDTQLVHDSTSTQESHAA